MRWLVTGAAGFTGGYLLEALRGRGDEVVTLGRSATNSLRCDVADRDGLAAAVRQARPDRVVHLAAVASVTHPAADDYQRVNVAGTENLLAACAALPSPPVVALASSSNVYGIHAGIIREDHATAPVSDYGRSKLAMEAAAARWAGRLPLLVVRPFNYTGPGQSEQYLVAKLAAHFRRREPRLMLGTLEVLRDFSDVRDIADDYLALLDRPPGPFEVVNLCGGVGTSIAALVNAFSELTGHRPEIAQDPSLVRLREIPVLVGDPTNLIRLTGRAHRRPLVETLASMLAPAGPGSEP
jgi:nucleoside-diphosphate-sugar epimerase